ncbi:hypothetical protein K437DRAFT_253954 [Tilletiaria anomala UBC 951]|uniref:Phosphotransferase n=1 Tax=Tilletiaria anomala (strain ATCC 24038 / CBS 436.72 / UBC 951) TaxID=1037660 RepID=A0A066WFK1_TILAU|nr:uncharacterized protein K437DRAFT_253954 [Tilletiaria anomala UBC 951]KDN52752.1 hypothetical protein K437DRAFT_253954 [Tilletiaria anomala UBC 951]
MTSAASSSPQAGAIGASLSNMLDEVEAQFTLSKDKLLELTHHFSELYTYGLGVKGADMPMIPSFVTGLPDGKEKGTFLAMDLGGTNLRVCEVKLKGDHTFEIRQQKYRVSDALKKGPVADLFEYMAESVERFLNEFGTETDAGEDELLMGFTFSFPVEQTTIDRGALLFWTKGFNCPDAPGKDVVQLLQNALDKKHIKVRVNALVNDTVGTLLTRSYQTGGAILGAIFGTGTNGAYLESIERIKKIKVSSQGQAGPTHMVINTEWGSFDNARTVLPTTQFDNFVDRTALRQRHHLFEKMISGMYLGEVARAVIIYLIDNLVLFSGFSSATLNTQYGLDTAYMSMIEADIDNGNPTSGSNGTREVLTQKLGLRAEHVSDVDVETVRRIVRFVGTRAARLSATAVAGTLIHTGNIQDDGTGKQVNVGVDGSLAELYPHFEERMRIALRDIVGEDAEKRVKFGLAKDGSGVGAALGAAAAKKQRTAGHRVEAN